MPNVMAAPETKHVLVLPDDDSSSIPGIIEIDGISHDIFFTRPIKQEVNEEDVKLQADQVICESPPQVSHQ